MIGALAAAVHALYGNVDLWDGLLIAAPAIVGVLGGTALQQRISERTVAGAVRRSAGGIGGSAGVLMDLVGLLIGVLSPLGVLVDVVLANVVPERALELSFAAVQLGFAWQLAGKAGLR